MLFKKLSIPLCDLRLQKVGSNNELTHIMGPDLKSGDDTRMEHNETDKGMRRMRQLRSEVEGQEESDEEKEEEDYEVRKVRVVKKIVKILSDSESEDDKREDSTSKKKVKKRAVKETRKIIVTDFEEESSESEDSSSEEEDNSDEDPDFDIECCTLLKKIGDACRLENKENRAFLKGKRKWRGLIRKSQICFIQGS